MTFSSAASGRFPSSHSVWQRNSSRLPLDLAEPGPPDQAIGHLRAPRASSALATRLRLVPSASRSVRTRPFAGSRTP